MIRIDEIYQNVFLPMASQRPNTGLHWFDPFGSTDFSDLVNLPPITNADHRIVFWDQEPLHFDRIDRFFVEFFDRFSGPTTIITSEKNSLNVQVTCEKYDLGSHYYFFHAWAALDWYRGYDRTFLSIPFADRKISHTFICPNNIIGGARAHRLRLLKELSNHEIIDQNLISFPRICPYERVTAEQLCKKENIDIDFSHIILPLKIDDGIDHHNNSHCIDLWNQASISFLQVVTETVYQGRRWHLTEKSFKPIVMQQPFVLVACQGSLEYLRSYGFQTFGEIWDERYDDADDDARIVAIGKLLKDLDDLSLREKKQLQKHIWPIVKHNFDWFYSREFENILWNELTTMIQKI
jgi:hypothetical protein